MFKTLPLILLVLCVLVPTSLQLSSLPWQVNIDMASRTIRYHHYVWHNIRNTWNQLSSAQQAQVAQLGWRPPRPAQDAKGKPLTENNSGEDFLYFHRQMIATVNRLLSNHGFAHVSGFTTIPAANDHNYPMQPVYTAPTAVLTKLVKYYKSNTYYNYVKNEEKKLTNPAFLRTMTLGQLGAYIELVSDVHQGMHFRFSGFSSLMRPKATGVIPYIDPKWDVNASNWMGDIYCSQVNPWFWKVHGWIDNRINDWMRAHNLKTISWKGTWTGASMSGIERNNNITDDPNVRFLGKKNEENDDNNADRQLGNMNMTDHTGSNTEMEGMDHGSMNITNLEAVAKILMESGISSDYFNELSSRSQAPEHWDDDGDDEKGGCSNNRH